MTNIQTIYTENAPAPAGHYSQAIVHNGVVYVAGQLPIDQDGNKRSDAAVEEQAELVFRNTEAILQAAGSSLGRILSVTIYVSNIENWGKINAVYSRIMGGHKPARAVVPVPELHYGLALEVQVIAAV
ncbi:MAG: Rid family detoxifying hydrolase [Saprospiraceae bacterium]|nr:Rid family detoxifying hydrolase [Saprospiraceae bacterium]MDZ4703334.1 Rid family detoxifying hydrolase [Saprospiraceae bacterium]